MASAHAGFALTIAASRSFSFTIVACPSPSPTHRPAAASVGVRNQQRASTATACLQQPSASHDAATRLYVSGLSFRTTEQSLRDAFEKFGDLTEVCLVMDRVAKRPRGFALLSYTEEEEARGAMEGMHGKVKDVQIVRCLCDNLLIVRCSDNL
ncbi:organelle RRM domain-containing protein 6, chloroplastic-like isoform X1 [Miscanthus floridulus]|uniref:organelle RRM domain-containing protein 6, chloroplastic-like isoform X1 n=1 Tax=Miscanthus floridulus TaxID=154761 RepID=UPI0034576AB3